MLYLWSFIYVRSVSGYSFVAVPPAIATPLGSLSSSLTLCYPLFSYPYTPFRYTVFSNPLLPCHSMPCHAIPCCAHMLIRSCPSIPCIPSIPSIPPWLMPSVLAHAKPPQPCPLMFRHAAYPSMSIHAHPWPSHPCHPCHPSISIHDFLLMLALAQCFSITSLLILETPSPMLLSSSSHTLFTVQQLQACYKVDK